MPRISGVQVANLIKQADAIEGMPRGTTGPQWVALARNEAGPKTTPNYDINAALFNTDAYNPIECAPGHHAWGIMQFCTNTLSKEKALSPNTAVMEAFKLHKRRGWQPWAGSHSPSASDRQAWEAAEGGGAGIGVTDLPGFGAALVTNPLESVQAAIASLLKPIEAFSNFFGDAIDIMKDVANWVGDPKNWLRILQVGGGLILGISAVTLIAKPVIVQTKRDVSPFS